MIDVTEPARRALAPAQLRWALLDREDTADSPPDPPEQALQRDTQDVKQAPVAQAYRSWFWSLDVDPTKRRPAGEALGRRLATGGLPEIHPLVDAYNQASAITLVPLSAFDREALDGRLRLDLPDPDERLDALGEAEPVAPTGHHPVWRDEQGPVGLVAYRDARRTALGPDSQAAIVVTLAPTDVPAEHLEEAFDVLARFAEPAGWRIVDGPEARAIR